MHDDWGDRSRNWAGVSSRTIVVAGTPVHVLIAGENHPGTPQLLVHGLGGSATNWLEVMGPLAAHGPVLAPDLPGFGRTRPPRPGATHVQANAGFLVALLRNLGWDTAIVQGNSMGGLLAVLLASAVPERVHRLVLSAPALPAVPRAGHHLHRDTLTRYVPFLVPGMGLRMVRRLHERTTPEELYADSARYIHADPTRLSSAATEVSLENVVYGRSQDWRHAGFVTAAESVIRTIAARRRLERAVRAIEAPTLVVWGDRDRLIPRPVIERLGQLRPDWRLDVLTGVGHAAMLEAPERYLNAVRPWLAESSPSATS